MTVRSPDGTPIGVTVIGKGPPLLLVHGTSSDHTRWMPLAPLLAPSFTLHIMDRRGRGLSDDTLPYRIDREIDDIMAVVESIGGDIDVLAHSYGALCTLQAAPNIKQIRRLALYEPPIATGQENRYTPDVVAAIGQLDAQQNWDGLLEMFYNEILSIDSREVSEMRASTDWKNRVAAAPTIARELQSINAYRVDPSRYLGWSVPTLLILGGASPERYRITTEYLNRLLTGSRIVELPGQRHMAMATAPQLLADAIREFVLS